ncbi:hypothetical protein JOD18_000697 [Gracilibacillus alcaliphilus]|nr:hypothetical protein [Gracilibacillus alcaliphilus]
MGATWCDNLFLCTTQKQMTKDLFLCRGYLIFLNAKELSFDQLPRLFYPFHAMILFVEAMLES